MALLLGGRPFATQCSTSQVSQNSVLVRPKPFVARMYGHGHNFQHISRATGTSRRLILLNATTSTAAAHLIAEGSQKYSAGDRQGALRMFEKALNESPTASERQAALFNSTAVHASFGDIEQAQITLRDGINSGLNFEAALQDRDNSSLVRFQGAPQVTIQLKRFAAAVKKVKEAVGSERKAPRAAAGGLGSGLGGGNPAAAADQRLADMLRTDVSGIDPTMGGLVRRVALVLVAGIGLGAALFYIGLKLAFPAYSGN